jgi:cytochrome P450
MTLYIFLQYTSRFVDRDMFVVQDTNPAIRVSVLIYLYVLQEKVYEEMTRIFESSDRRFTREDLEQMEYLDRVIKETLRLYRISFIISRLNETDVQIGELRVAYSVCTRFILLVF